VPLDGVLPLFLWNLKPLGLLGVLHSQRLLSKSQSGLTPIDGGGGCVGGGRVETPQVLTPTAMKAFPISFTSYFKSSAAFFSPQAPSSKVDRAVQ
jgi:hypothetical protein